MATFHCHFTVNLPVEMDPEIRADHLERNREYVRQQQAAGHWPQLWQVAGRCAAIAVLEVADTDQLHRVLSALPLYNYLDIEITPLTGHQGI